jgi:hypothetical protein
MTGRAVSYDGACDLPQEAPRVLAESRSSGLRIQRGYASASRIANALALICLAVGKATGSVLENNQGFPTEGESHLQGFLTEGEYHSQIATALGGTKRYLARQK